MLPAAAVGRPELESQTHLSGVSGHETQLASSSQAASAQAGTGTAVCAASAGFGVVGRLRGRCAGLWPAVSPVQYGGRLQPGGCAYRGGHLNHLGAAGAGL